MVMEAGTGSLQLHMQCQSGLLACNHASTHAGQLGLFTHADAAGLAQGGSQCSANMRVANQSAVRQA